MFQSRSISALTCEPALRYVDPLTATVQVVTMGFLQRQRDAGVYKTSLGLELLVPPVPGLGTDLPIVGTLGSAKVIFQGPEALETLGKLLMSKQRNQIVFDASVTSEIDPEPLKLVGFSVGKKGTSSRSLSYEFKAGRSHPFVARASGAPSARASQQRVRLERRKDLSARHFADVALPAQQPQRRGARRGREVRADL